MDMLEQAKERYAGANETGYEHGAQLAQAAALIAIAERLDKLIDRLDGVTDEGDSIRITSLR